jgi:hypothetical protein
MDGVNVNTTNAVCVRSDDVISQHQYPDTPVPVTAAKTNVPGDKIASVPRLTVALRI